MPIAQTNSQQEVPGMASSTPSRHTVSLKSPEDRIQHAETPRVSNAADSLYNIGTPLPIQHVCSLDQLDGATAQLCGISADMDPWLLRHCRYDEYGLCRLHGTLFRNVGGVPVQGLVPVHFVLADNQLLSPVTTEPAGEEAMRWSLNQLIPPGHGELLLSLWVHKHSPSAQNTNSFTDWIRFLTHVFPMLPVVSRSQLERQKLDLEAPVILLAAIYASALPYVAHDPVLFVSGAYDHDLRDQLWEMVSQGIQEQTRTPGLAVLQASILYLQRLPSRTEHVLSDTPLRSSFHGRTVAVAMSLGLHLEPRPWGIPAWEKRLRRRLWWAIYLEDKWTSLLLGRPPTIREDEWDVFELDELDFELDDPMAVTRRLPIMEQPSRGIIFRYFIKLAQLVETIHHTF